MREKDLGIWQTWTWADTLEEIRDLAMGLRALGLGDEEIEEKFGFLLNALSAGAPPHGGIALGMDRIVQRFTGSPSLRDTVAFPKTTAARALYEGAPTPVGGDDLDALGLRLRDDVAGQGEEEA